jgi:hypothetical protein
MTSNLFTLCITAALSPPPEPVEAIKDKVVDQLLNEAAEVVLKED